MAIGIVQLAIEKRHRRNEYHQIPAWFQAPKEPPGSGVIVFYMLEDIDEDIDDAESSDDGEDIGDVT